MKRISLSPKMIVFFMEHSHTELSFFIYIHAKDDNILLNEMVLGP